ncbi:MAG TPA: DUF485 domain-containing protein [Propionibacteriaceae bacterium]|jgi:uncharacterized membrane protein (DUF485 family)|nr:DUF485 domain-containing protein [Propionibacteriaceae bacterium]
MPDRGAPVYESGEADRLPAHNHEVYNRIAQESDFVELRRRYLSFAFPATIAFMAWYILYIVCNNWARNFMNIEVLPNINVALVWGLLQFVSTFAIAYFYARHASKSLDPLASKLRDEFDLEVGQ